jgi:tetratricopeptide (TPR) repeat protein
VRISGVAVWCFADTPDIGYTLWLAKDMSRVSAVRSPTCLVLPVICGLLVIPPLAGVRAAQEQRSPQDLLKEAESLQQAGRLDQAIEDYRLILKQYPDVAPVRSDLGATLAAAGRYQEAIVEYERALQLQPLPQIRLNLALAYYKADKLDLAVETLKKVREEMPDDLRPAMLLADCYLRLGQNKRVIDLLDPLQPTHADDLGLIYMLGTALVRDGQVARGQVIIDKILKNGDSAEARLLLGTTELAVHQPQAALTDLQKAIELDPKLVSAHSIYGRALMAAANPEEAQKAFRAELSINPNDFDSNLYLGVLLKEEQRYSDALPYLQHALEVRPGDPGARYQIAALHLAEQDFSDAQRELEALVKSSPDFLEAHVSLATLDYRLKRKEDGDRERAIVAKLTAEKQARESAEAKQTGDQKAQ